MHPDEIDFLLNKYGISGTVEKKKPTKSKIIRLATEQRAQYYEEMKQRAKELLEYKTKFHFDYPKVTVPNYRKRMEKGINEILNPPTEDEIQARKPKKRMTEEPKYKSYV